jgi:hypothetical protein
MRIFRSQCIYNKWALIVFLCLNPWASFGAGETIIENPHCLDYSLELVESDAIQSETDEHIEDMDRDCGSESQENECCPKGCMSSCGLPCCGLICVLEQERLFIVEQTTNRFELILNSFHNAYYFGIFHPPKT